MQTSPLTSETLADVPELAAALAQGPEPGAKKCPEHGTPMMFIGGKDRCPDCCVAEVVAQQKRDDESQALERQQVKQQQRQADLEKRIGAAGIPERFRALTFDSFPGTSPQAVKTRDTLRAYANTWPTNLARGISILLVGGTGTGKTGLACAVANAVMQTKGATAAFMSAYGAVRHQRDTWGRRGKTEREALDDLLLPDLLVLDEVGASVGTDTETAMLFEVLNGRYAAQRPTILISNLPLDDYTDAAGSKRPGLRTILGPRIMDRFSDDGSFTLACQWPSLRKERARG